MKLYFCPCRSRGAVRCTFYRAEQSRAEPLVIPLLGAVAGTADAAWARAYGHVDLVGVSVEVMYKHGRVVGNTQHTRIGVCEWNPRVWSSTCQLLLTTADSCLLLHARTSKAWLSQQLWPPSGTCVCQQVYKANKRICACVSFFPSHSGTLARSFTLLLHSTLGTLHAIALDSIALHSTVLYSTALLYSTLLHCRFRLFILLLMVIR